MQTVKDETELPADGQVCYYLRLASDPTLMIASKTGELWRREDGKNWEWPAHEVYGKRNDLLDPWRLDYSEPRTTFDSTIRHRDGTPTIMPHSEGRERKKYA